MDWLLITYCDIISGLDSHSDGTHSLQRIQTIGEQVMLNFIYILEPHLGP